MIQASFTSWIEYPRWWQIRSYLEGMAMMHELKIEFIETKGWLRVHLVFKASGEQADLIRFQKSAQDLFKKLS